MPYWNACCPFLLSYYIYLILHQLISPACCVSLTVLKIMGATFDFIEKIMPALMSYYLKIKFRTQILLKSFGAALLKFKVAKLELIS